MFNASNAFHVLCYFQAYAIECHISNYKSDRELRIACSNGMHVIIIFAYASYWFLFDFSHYCLFHISPHCVIHGFLFR